MTNSSNCFCESTKDDLKLEKMTGDGLSTAATARADTFASTATNSNAAATFAAFLRFALGVFALLAFSLAFAFITFVLFLAFALAASGFLALLLLAFLATAAFEAVTGFEAFAIERFALVLTVAAVGLTFGGRKRFAVLLLLLFALARFANLFQHLLQVLSGG